MTLIIKATFFSLPEERDFIKNLKRPKILTYFPKLSEYTFLNYGKHKYIMCQEKLH